jgi:hypothetical protein
MKPTRAGSASGRISRWPESRGFPARLPRLTASVNSAEWRIRAAAGSTGAHLPRRRASDADALAALPAPGGQDGPARPGAHAQPEAMRLGTATVVRLERTLAHQKLQGCSVTGNLYAEETGISGR